MYMNQTYFYAKNYVQEKISIVWENRPKVMYQKNAQVMRIKRTRIYSHNSVQAKFSDLDSSSKVLTDPRHRKNEALILQD